MRVENRRPGAAGMGESLCLCCVAQMQQVIYKTKNLSYLKQTLEKN
ncbi:hypothetical protein BER2_2734 [plant metagenome]|uniref:Uncharacterized protein n=1 Tax=plant metagenome TaxID=1297885 RepID=A0A484RKA0_9ZZZZ